MEVTDFSTQGGKERGQNFRSCTFPGQDFQVDIVLSVSTQLKKIEPDSQACLFSSYNLSFNRHDRATAHLSATVQPRDTLNSAFLKGIVRPESTA